MDSKRQYRIDRLDHEGYLLVMRVVERYVLLMSPHLAARYPKGRQHVGLPA